ncbi:YtxH domain-containing protein [Virgibacillus sp. W0430]|uniref:YtxH domain-containing protein n=1 Tax=Virgibacillus sp. W0430 TaxID=3391580 RepID=UPI003F44E909
MTENNVNTKDFIIGTFIGGIVGAAVALLFAPKSGKELRGDINYGASQAMERASDLKDTAQVRGAEWKEKALEKGNELSQKAKDKTAQLSKNVTEKTQGIAKSAQERVANIQEKQAEKANQ